MSVSYGRLIRIIWVIVLIEVLIVNKSQEERFMFRCSFEQKHGLTCGW